MNVIDLTNEKPTGTDGWGDPYRIGSSFFCHPWSLYFVYAPCGNYLLKGKSDVVEAYMKKHLPICLYRYTYWKNGEHRGSWRFSFPGMYVEDANPTSNRKYKIFAYKKKSHPSPQEPETMTLTFRRIPKKWLDEYTEMAEFVGVKVG